MASILIAEDDKFILDAYRVKLSKAGYDLKLAKDGEEALDILKDFKPDLVILDLIMPKKDGFAVLEKIRKNDDLKDVPVIVSSNLGQKEDLEKAEKLGSTDYLVKSDLSIDSLLEKVENLLDKK